VERPVRFATTSSSGALFLLIALLGREGRLQLDCDQVAVIKDC